MEDWSHGEAQLPSSPELHIYLPHFIKNNNDTHFKLNESAGFVHIVPELSSKTSRLLADVVTHRALRSCFATARRCLP